MSYTITRKKSVVLNGATPDLRRTRALARIAGRYAR